MPAPAKPEKDKSTESLGNFSKKAEPHDAFLGMIALLARIEIEIKNEGVTQPTAALEVLSHIYERDANGTLPLQEWNANAFKLSKIMPTVCIPLWAFEALAKGWGEYMTASTGVEFTRAMGFNKQQGQGNTAVPKTLEKKLRDFVFTQEVIILRRVQNRNGKNLSIDKACSQIANKNSVKFELVRDAYYAERKNCKQIFELIGDQMETSY